MEDANERAYKVVRHVSESRDANSKENERTLQPPAHTKTRSRSVNHDIWKSAQNSIAGKSGPVRKEVESNLSWNDGMSVKLGMGDQAFGLRSQKHNLNDMSDEVLQEPNEFVEVLQELAGHTKTALS